MTGSTATAGRRRARARASACAPSCATPGASRSRRAATPATAAPAPCSSTARRCTPASTRPPAARRPRGHHRRRPRHPRGPAPGAARVRRRGRLPVRLLHRRLRRHRGRARRRGRPGDDVDALLQGQPVPLHRLPLDPRRPRRHAQRRPDAADGGRVRRLARARRPRPRIVTGTEPYTLDLPDDRRAAHGAGAEPARRTPGSPRIDTTRAEAAPGVRLVLTHHDVPDVLYSTARHESRLDDPDDTRMLDDVVRFRGQRVAAVVAESVGAAAARRGPGRGRVRRAAGRLRPRGRPRARRPAAARREGHRRVAGSPSRSRNVVAQTHGEVGDVAAGLAAAARDGERDLAAPRGSPTPRWRPTAPAAGSTTTAGW